MAPAEARANPYPGAKTGRPRYKLAVVPFPFPFAQILALLLVRAR